MVDKDEPTETPVAVDTRKRSKKSVEGEARVSFGFGFATFSTSSSLTMEGMLQELKQSFSAILAGQEQLCRSVKELEDIDVLLRGEMEAHRQQMTESHQLILKHIEQAAFEDIIDGER